MKITHTIGRIDKVDLPELGIENAKAKIDTGAYTSSLHCNKIKVEDSKLSFFIQLEYDNGTIHRDRFETSTFKVKTVKSSNGMTEDRYVIKTKIVLFGRPYLTEFSLTDRSSMKNPILIGRKLLNQRFMVDVSKKNLSFNLKKSNNEIGNPL